MAENSGWMSIPEIAKEIGTTEYSVNRAIEQLGLNTQAKRDLSDRRRIIYPPGVLEKIKAWLEKP